MSSYASIPSDVVARLDRATEDPRGASAWADRPRRTGSPGHQAGRWRPDM